jgi:EAL domain-containing protein (putative c-di-GMP-specific phosphodiesterase class I)
MLGTTGNQRLQADAASRLSLYLASMTTDRETDLRDLFLASLGAGQFGVLMPAGTTRKAAADLVRELHQVFEDPFNIDGRNIKVTISGGLAMGPEDGDLPEILLKNASLALNEVLRAGKIGFQFFSPRLERIALGRTRFEQELRDAVSAEAFHPVFQPKIDLGTQQVIGVEALARWKRSEGRVISPGTFIPLAEELGLIDEIGFQILRQSCKAAADWLKDGMQISVAVNVSPRQFDRPDFVDQVVEALRASHLPPQFLELEITETMAVSNPDRVINVMKPLRAMGIKLAVDDFGTGHANLSLLTQIPFDIFKIDRQFVMGIEEDAHAPAIVEMTLAMAKTLGLKTVAEGIETEAQATFLKERGCHLAQGFLYSPGIPDEEFRDLMTKWGQNPSAKQLSA